MNRQRRKEHKIYKRRLSRSKWKKRINREKNKKKKEKQKSKSKTRYYSSKIISVPPLFSMHQNRNGVLRFINSLKAISKKTYREIFFDFSTVLEVSHGAITILLSTIGWLNDNGVSVSGNYPDNENAKKQFQASGFLEFFQTIGKRDYERGKNTIVARGQSKSNAQLTAKLIREASETIWELNCKNMKVQGMLVELMANTVNHAYILGRSQKGWYFSLDHIQEENKVKFCFVDNGLGILRTLERKWRERLITTISGNSDETLKKAYLGEYGSRTKLSHRGRGLKVIKKVAEMGYIKGLRVITNDKFYDFDNDQIEQIPEKFDGTFYFWEIDKTCNR